MIPFRANKRQSRVCLRRWLTGWQVAATAFPQVLRQIQSESAPWLHRLIQTWSLLAQMKRDGDSRLCKSSPQTIGWRHCGFTLDVEWMHYWYAQWRQCCLSGHTCSGWWWHDMLRMLEGVFSDIWHTEIKIIRSSNRNTLHLSVLYIYKAGFSVVRDAVVDCFSVSF